MATVEESICCHEYEELKTKIEDSLGKCVTDSLDFDSCCLNMAVLELAYYAYVEHYGNKSRENTSIHEYVLTLLCLHIT
jgi:hypothetical protein